MTADTKLRHAPADWKMGLTRVVHTDGQHGTFVRNSHPLPEHNPTGWLGVLVRFDGGRDLVDVDPADLTVTCLRDPFAAIAASLPTRYAPGYVGNMPYYMPGDETTWRPVLYYPAGVVIEDEGPIWLVEPYPADRVEGSDGLDPIDGAGVAVVRGAAAPRPRSGDPGSSGDASGDWIVPQTSPCGDVAYDVHVTSQRDALAAWVQAYAIAAALNDNLLYRLGVEADDIEVLLAAERRALTGAPLGVAHYQDIGAEPGDPRRRVSREQIRRLVGAFQSMLQPVTVDDAGHTTYGLAPAGVKALTAIRRHGADHDGPRCRECGCTEDRACPDGCLWLTLTDPAGPLCSACPAARRR